MSKIYDSAYALEKAISESEEFLALKASFEGVMNNDLARKKFENFRDTQMALQEKQMQGLEITEEEITEARDVVDAVQDHEEISKLMEAEQRLNIVINDVSRIITKQLEELYGHPLSEEDEAEEE